MSFPREAIRWHMKENFLFARIYLQENEKFAINLTYDMESQEVREKRVEYFL